MSGSFPTRNTWYTSSLPVPQSHAGPAATLVLVYGSDTYLRKTFSPILPVRICVRILLSGFAMSRCRARLRFVGLGAIASVLLAILCPGSAYRSDGGLIAGKDVGCVGFPGMGDE